MGVGFDEEEIDSVCEKTNAGGRVSRRERRRGESQERIRGAVGGVREEYASDIEFVQERAEDRYYAATDNRKGPRASCDGNNRVRYAGSIVSTHGKVRSRGGESRERDGSRSG